MEEMYRKLITDLKQQHQKELAALLKEKDQQLQQESAATVTGEEVIQRLELFFLANVTGALTLIVI